MIVLNFRIKVVIWIYFKFTILNFLKSCDLKIFDELHDNILRFIVNDIKYSDDFCYFL